MRVNMIKVYYVHYENSITRPTNHATKKVREWNNRRGKYDQSTLHTCLKNHKETLLYK
jgi:hypothetical protein